MTNQLDQWLARATRHLSRDSAAQVRTEIREHYDSARDAALISGAGEDEADRAALAALGDPKRANCQYRQVLLTSAEARVLRQGAWESKAVCSLGFVRQMRIWLPLLALVAALVLFLKGSGEAARTVLIAAVGMGFLILTPSLPIYTQRRSRILRYIKWIVLAGMPLLVFGHDALKYCWLLIASLWPVYWVEYQRVAIRRKLPVAQWPRHLYL